MKKLTIAEKAANARARRVYEAEKAAGICFLHQFLSPMECQAYIDYIVKTRWWRNRTGIAKITLEYIPVWEEECSMEDHRTKGKMVLSLGCLNEGIINHELWHNAPGDVDNSHDEPFLRFGIAFTKHFVSDILASRFETELKLRRLL